MSVNKERVALLVAALESGEFTQTANNLRTEEGYCCLGVACEVYRRHTHTGEWKEMPFGGASFVDDIGNTESIVMPNAVVEWYGLPDPNPNILDTDGMPMPAAKLNDDGYTFKQIAEGFRNTFLGEK